MFALTMPLWEIAARGTLAYLALILLVRFIPKRNAGHISPNDILTLVLIGAMGSDAILGGSTSMVDILLMMGVIVGWGYALDLLEYRFPACRGILRDCPTQLVRHGRTLRHNMQRELVTEEELAAALRSRGIDDVAAVRSAFLEADGRISIVPARDQSERASPSHSSAGRSTRPSARSR